MLLIKSEYLRGAQGRPFWTENSKFWDIKLQIYGAEAAENFGKFRVFKEKSAIFWSFKGKFGQILINLGLLTILGVKVTVFSISKKLRKFRGIF